MKYSFNEFIEEYTSYIKNKIVFSSSLTSIFKQAYEVYGIDVHAFYNADKNTNTEEEIKNKINSIIMNMYKIQFHNIGKDPYNRFFRMEKVAPWLKLEILLIRMSKNAKQVKMRPSNLSLAIKLGWLTKDETRPEVIAKALRKVTDNLAKLKNERGTISVQQCYVYGKQGSYHWITINYIKIVQLYSSYTLEKGQTIRFRKAIKYRIISLIKKNSKSYSQALVKLIQKQKNSYLSNLVKFSYEKLKDAKYWVDEIFFNKKNFDNLPLYWRDTTNFIPTINEESGVITLRIKNRDMYNELSRTENRYTEELSFLGYRLNLIAAF